jgi:hypothetical protein
MCRYLLHRTGNVPSVTTEIQELGVAEGVADLKGVIEQVVFFAYPPVGLLASCIL